MCDMMIEIICWQLNRTNIFVVLLNEQIQIYSKHSVTSNSYLLTTQKRK